MIKQRPPRADRRSTPSWGIRSSQAAFLCRYPDGKLVICSQQPCGVFCGLSPLVYPVLHALQGLKPKLLHIPAVATSGFPKKGGPRRFLLGYTLFGPEGWRVAVLSGQKSSMRRSLADCNCLIDLAAGHPPVKPGEQVFIILIQNII